MIEAKIVLDSVSPEGHRLTTFQLRYPKFIHAEFMTHRVFSRNASSSRAVPTLRLLEEVRSDELRATPVWWGKNQPGMQASEELSDKPVILRPGDTDRHGHVVSELTEMHSPRQVAREAWRQAALAAALAADRLRLAGAHKQIVNRVLEPFTHINVVVTATEYANFFGLRLDAGAQPEMRALAQAMVHAYNTSSPSRLLRDEWHLPFVEAEDFAAMEELDGCALGNRTDSPAIRVSVARCARVSYTSFETGRRSTVEEDLALYEKLMGAQPLHASPAEHQATPDEYIGGGVWNAPNLHGNFEGWNQYRKFIPGEDCARIPL